MRQHWTRDDIANGIDAWNVRGIMCIDFDLIAIVQRNPDLFHAKALSIRAATDGEQHNISRKCFLRTTCGRFHRQRDTTLSRVGADHLHAETKLDSLLL